jgi:zinc protease
MPLDRSITSATLPNGLRYYVLSHQKPQKRAQFWLVVNAGSVLEDDDQQGLAHFVEHMGFDGTRRYPKRALIDLFEKNGARFGADLNASTSADQTVFRLQVPTDRADAVDGAIQVLRDWADGIAFDPAELERERGVVLEEWRLGRGAAARLRDKLVPVLMNGSQYAVRLPIGKPDVIRSAPRSALVRFYQDWYRPDLMAVVAVGDFAAADIERRIRSEFASLTARPNPRPRPVIALPAHDQPLVSIEADAELPNTSVTIVHEVPHMPEASPRDLRRLCAQRLYYSMLNARLDEVTRQPDPPFLAGNAAILPLTRTTDAFTEALVVKEDGIERGFGALLEEILRVERHGFTASELERAKAQVHRFFEQLVKEKDNRDSSDLAAEMVRNFLLQESMSGVETERALVDRFLPTFTLEEIDAWAKTTASGSPVIAVSGPMHRTRPSAEGLLALSKDVAARDIAPYDDAAPTEPLIAVPPKTGTVVATKAIAEIGVTEWTLSNGVRVVLKPTNFANDEVQMTAFSPGGHSLVGDGDYPSARFAAQAVVQGGLGSLDLVRLRKSLAGKVVTVTPYIAELEEGLSGRSSAADLETMLQMTYDFFTRPRRDERAFAAWRAREIETVRNRRLSPERQFADDMAVFSSQGHLRRRPETPEILEKVRLDKAIQIFRERFASANGFTFVFVGNVNRDALEPLVRTYLGSLPSAERKETWRDVHVSWAPGVATKTVARGTEPKSLVALTFHGAETWSLQKESDLSALADVLRIRLRQVLRDELGSVYGVQVSWSMTRRPRPEYTLQVDFGCSPEHVAALEKAVFDEIRSIQEKGPASDVIDKVKEAKRRSLETQTRGNSFWLRELARAYRFGDDPKLLPDASLIDAIGSEPMRAAATKYLRSNQYVLGVLEPEKVVAPGAVAAPR